jgi:apolipoprotein N-acyltransferase
MLLGWVGLVPWFAVLERTASIRQALFCGVLMSVAFVGSVFWWFAVAIGEYTGGGLLLAVPAVIVFAPLFQPQFVAAAIAGRLARRGGQLLRVLSIASAYCAAEWWVPKLFGDTIGHGLYASRLLRQGADLCGAAGLTFALVTVNLCVLEAARRLRREPRAALLPATIAVIVPISLLAYGSYRLGRLEADVPSAGVTAAVVQANLVRYADLAAQAGTYEATRTILEAHFDLSSQALREAEADVLVWPETMYPTTFGAPKSEAGAELDRSIAGFAASAGVPLIFGAYDRGDDAEYNAAIFLHADAGGADFEAYRKGSLFPLTERVPWLMESETVRRWMPWLGTWKPGDAPRVIDVRLRSGRTLRVAPMICYDAVDPGRALAAVRDGAEILVALSNDSWLAAGGGPWLHLVVSAFRSLETRRAQIRATTTGISAFITPTGDIVASAGIGERASFAAHLPVARDAETVMLAWGDWFGAAATVATVLCLGVILLRVRAAGGREDFC